MNAVYLLPQKFKVIGWLLFVPSLVLGIYMLVFHEIEIAVFDWVVPWYGKSVHQDNFTNELVMLLVLVSAMMVSFSKSKEEDEYVKSIRHDSLIWSLYVNYALLFIGIVGVYDFGFVNVLVLNMYTPLIIFIVRFQFYYVRR